MAPGESDSPADDFSFVCKLSSFVSESNSLSKEEKGERQCVCVIKVSEMPDDLSGERELSTTAKAKTKTRG